MLRKIGCFLYVFIFISSLALAWEGSVVGVSDGDTITILNDNKEQFKIRLSGIDAPESGQAFGKASKERMSALVYGKIVEVTPVTTDKYDRTVARIHVSDLGVEEEMIRSGMAWVYSKYCLEPICDQWMDIQTNARSMRVGLWADQDPIPPWEWRHNKNSVSSVKHQNAARLDRSKVSQPVVFQNQLVHGNISSHVYHGSQCRHYNCSNCVKVFNSSADALNEGYRPCRICNP